jgi:[ribosomal protein S5]-alanine N-acetyltransferase
MRHWSPDDVEGAFRLFGDPEVMRYVGDGRPHADHAYTRGWIERAIAYDEKHGICRWAVDEKESGQLIGSCGFMYPYKDDDVDLGYYFGRAYWGRGFAAEIASACLKYGFETLKLKQVSATVDVRHEVSQHLLKKLGFEFVKIIDNDDGTVDHYCLVVNPSMREGQVDRST